MVTVPPRREPARSLTNSNQKEQPRLDPVSSRRSMERATPPTMPAAEVIDFKYTSRNYRYPPRQSMQSPSWIVSARFFPRSSRLTSGVYSQRRRCRLVGDKLKFSAQWCIDPAHGQDTPCTRPRPKASLNHNGTVAS